MKQRDLAALFNLTADMLEFRGENPFRIRAYRRAAQQLDGFSGDLDLLGREDRLTELPGIGKDLAAKIREYLTAGSIREIEALKSTIPAGVLSLLEVPGVGPKTTKLLYERLRIASIDQLERAARAHRLRQLPGFQETKEQNILKGIALVRKGRERMHLGVALPLSRRIVEALRSVSAVKQVAVAGSLRRMKETIGDLDILVTTKSAPTVMRFFTTAPFCSRVLAAGQTKSSILTPEGVQVDLRVVEPDSFGAALQYFTGSKEHNVRIREMAVRKGLKINEYGVFRMKGGTRVAGREEAEIYDALGLSWIPPEIREDGGEIEAALGKRLPRLVEESDLRGDFHIHTHWSDGHDTLEQVARAGQARGYEYLAICDHSPSLRVANGLSVERLRKQMTEIAALNRRLRGFQLLRGAEVDILSDGRMDYPDELLAQMDFVIGSIHSGFKQDEATITRRLTSAMRHRSVTMIAHPTGRLLGQRESYAFNAAAVFQAATETGTALELNAFPQRLDLNDALARQARDAGVRLAISTDTHRLEQLEHIAIGVAVARRAWLEPRHLLNCLSRQELLAWIARKRGRSR
ncbi:MAG: DNA polymerase/3'-5' exonuclease PolX [Candidatus Omnitrophica bacterium]|nr:DNA polymerase/3'-5' exonuclease PolX [Candidatus Omnitrophota bacterium]